MAQEEGEATPEAGEQPKPQLPSKDKIIMTCVIFALAFIALLIILIAFALMSALTGNKSGAPGETGVLSCTSSQLSRDCQEKIKNNLPVYQAAADKANVPWEFLAALHYRETNLSATHSNPFQINNPRYTGFSVDSATEAGQKAKALVQSVYHRNLSKTSGEETIKLAFLAYNRGAMYRDGGCTWDQSPYVMNQFDASHQNMVWPNNSCEPSSTRGKVDRRLGAFTVFSILKGCTTARLTGKTALPIDPSKITGYNNTLHRCSVSNPNGCTGSGHRVILGSLGTYGTNVPDNTLGEAVDLQAPGGTPVFAPFDGRVTFSSSAAALGEAGGFIVMQSADGKSATTLAHLQNYVRRGDILAAGQKAGELKIYSGSFGPHLHFELWINNQPVNAGGPGSGVTPQKIWEGQKKALGF